MFCLYSLSEHSETKLFLATFPLVHFCVCVCVLICKILGTGVLKSVLKETMSYLLG